MRTIIKIDRCPTCFGEIVIDDGKITCIEGHDLNEIEFEPFTAAIMQSVIDWQATAQGGQKPS